MTKDVPTSQQCPDRNAWSAFCLGQIDEPTLQALAVHLDSCTTCRDVLETVRPNSDDLIEEIRRSDMPDPFADEPECQAMVQKIQFLPDPKGASPEATIPERLGEYRILGSLGRGGMGAVYRAVHLRLGRPVALKTFPPGRAKDASAVARFHREMTAIGKLDHPHVVRATDAGEAEGVAFLVMDVVEGIDLSRLVRSRGPLPYPVACELSRQAASGLQHLATNGIVHRDLKPSNLMVGRDGTVKLLDLGLAALPDHSTDSGPTESGQVIGTVDFMAPEQADHARGVDSRADIYSLGCTLYYLLTGRAPYAAPRYPTLRSKLTAHAIAPIPAIRDELPDAPIELDTILRRMMAKEPSERYGSPAEVVEALAPFCEAADFTAMVDEAVAAGGDVHASISTPPPDPKTDLTITYAAPPAPRSRSRRVIVLAMSALALGGAVMAAILLREPAVPQASIAASVEDAHLAPMPRIVESPSIPAHAIPVTLPMTQTAPRVYPVAVVHFDERGIGSNNLGASVADLLFAKLSANPNIVLVERTDLKQSLDELQLNASGATNPENAVKVGQLTGARVIVAGSVIHVDRKILLVAKIIGTETSRTLGASVDGPIDGELATLVDRLSTNVNEVLTKEMAKLVPSPTTIVNRGEALKAKLGNRPRPSIAVRAGANDTTMTAVTETIRIAKAADFEVVDSETGPPAAVDVQLQVIAESAAPIGTLVPGRARVEAKAIERATGKVLASDRQTALTVDLTATLATRAAVEDATASLAARVLERLTPAKQ